MSVVAKPTRHGEVDEVVAVGEAGAVTFSGKHSTVASHLEWQVCKCVTADQVYALEIGTDESGTHRVHVRASNIRNARQHVKQAFPLPGMRVFDIPDVMSLDVFEASLPEGTELLVTEAVQRSLETERRLVMARASTDLAYRFTYLDPTHRNGARPTESRWIRALDLSDAEATLRAGHPNPSMRLTKVEILTLEEHIAGDGDSLEPDMSLGIVARDLQAA